MLGREKRGLHEDVEVQRAGLELAADVLVYDNVSKQINVIEQDLKYQKVIVNSYRNSINKI